MLGCTSSSGGSMSNARSSVPADSSSASTKKPSRFGKLRFRSSSINDQQQPRNQSDSASLPSAAPQPQPVEDTEERRELIEKAASERDEKRKKKVTEALESAQRRLDVAFSVIQAEMDDSIATSKWSTWEKKSALLLLVMLTFTHQYWIVSYLSCFGLMLYSYWYSSSRHLEAKQAGDNVGARLVDLEDGLRRCELAVQHDVEQEEEWTQMLLEETRQWEERQRELVARRGRGFPYTKRINTQRIRMVTQFHETADRAVQVMHKIEDVARKTLMPHAAVRESNGEESSTVMSSDLDSGASSAWKAYVNANLPLERLAVESPEEQVFSAQLRINSNGDWDLLPQDIQLMLLRGYADKKDRMKDSLEAVRYIIHWRAHTKCDTILQTATPEHESFFKAWGTVYAGEDKYGHIIIADRVETIDLSALFLLDDEFILETRTKQMEVLRRLKLNIEKRRGHRVCKHVYILDLAGLNIRKHFTPRVKNLLQSIFKVGGDAYPDSMWQMWLINTPFVFQLVWKALSPTIEASTKAKIRMLGGKEKYLPEMQKCGIPLESIPLEFGGEFPSVNFFQGLQQIIQEDSKEEEL